MITIFDTKEVINVNIETDKYVNLVVDILSVFIWLIRNFKNNF